MLSLLVIFTKISASLMKIYRTWEYLMLKSKQLQGYKNIDIIKTSTPFLSKIVFWTYFVRIDNVFIDSGNSNCPRRALIKYLNRLPARDKWLLLNTHLHEDHCGNNSVIQETLNADILAPERRSSLDLPLFYKIVWGNPKPFDYEIIEEKKIITDSGKTISAVPMPGHTKNHTCYYVEEDNILITGDAIPYPVNKIHTLIYENYKQTIANLKSLMEYQKKSTTIVTGHLGVLADPDDIINKRIGSMEEVVERVKREWKNNDHDIEKTTRACFGRPKLLDYLMGSRMSVENTVRSVVFD